MIHPYTNPCNSSAHKDLSPHTLLNCTIKINISTMSLSKPLRPHKPRFKDWLIYILDNEMCEDARWKDRSRRTAIIRWPHKSRGTWSLEKDAKLFRMWAVTSGKYRTGVDSPNPKSWKCNFRMNLNICKNIIELKHERIPKGPNACRVFKFLDRRTTLPSCQIYPETNYERTRCFSSQPREFYTSENSYNHVSAMIQDVERSYHNGTVHYGLHDVQPSLPAVTNAGKYLYPDMEEIPPQVIEEYCNLPHPTLSSETSFTGFEPVDQEHLHPPTSSASGVTGFEQDEEDQSLKLQIDSFQTTELNKMADSLNDFCQSHI